MSDPALERTPMTNDAERVSDIVAELRPAFVVDLPVSQAISALRDEGRFKSSEALNAWLVENNALKSAAMAIIEAQSKALAEAREWLIEQQSRTGSLSWWSLTDTQGEGGYFTGDSSKALRFARREDAQAYIDDAGWTEARPMPFRALTPTPENPNG
jgi:hypothetical protein